jgi:hypothetical protein
MYNAHRPRQHTQLHTPHTALHMGLRDEQIPGTTYRSGSTSVSDLQGYDHCGVEGTTDYRDHTGNL